MSNTIARLRPLPDPVTARPITDGVRIGHVHLKVADLERALSFYCGILGFELLQRRGREAAFISAGGYHHHIGLNTWAGVGAPPPPSDAIGLRHFTIELPGATARDQVVDRLRNAAIPVETVGEAILTRDPSSNAILLATRA